MTAPVPDDQRPGLHPPQFGLSAMLWMVALLCGVFALMGTVGPLGAFALVLGVLAIFAHIAGNAIGTTLRDNSSRAAKKENRHKEARRAVKKDEFAPTTKLSRRDSLGITIVITTAVGIVVGSVGGGTLLALINWGQLTWPSLLIACSASAVLGGIAGFSVSSLVHVLIVAQLQALRHARRR